MKNINPQVAVVVWDSHIWMNWMNSGQHHTYCHENNKILVLFISNDNTDPHAKNSYANIFSDKEENLNNT